MNVEKCGVTVSAAAAIRTSPQSDKLLADDEMGMRRCPVSGWAMRAKTAFEFGPEGVMEFPYTQRPIGGTAGVRLHMRAIAFGDHTRDRKEKTLIRSSPC